MSKSRVAVWCACFGVGAYLCIAILGDAAKESNEERFKRLDEQLRVETAEFDFGSEEFYQSPAFRKACESHDRDDLLLMAQQSDFYFVALAGFDGLRTRFPDSAFEFAVETVAKSERPGSLTLGHIHLYLAEIPNSAENRKRLDLI
mgnify:CR=1 FL=1